MRQLIVANSFILKVCYIVYSSFMFYSIISISDNENFNGFFVNNTFATNIATLREV